MVNDQNRGMNEPGGGVVGMSTAASDPTTRLGYDSTRVRNDDRTQPGGNPSASNQGTGAYAIQNVANRNTERSGPDGTEQRPQLLNPRGPQQPSNQERVYCYTNK